MRFLRKSVKAFRKLPGIPEYLNAQPDIPKKAVDYLKSQQKTPGIQSSRGYPSDNLI